MSLSVAEVERALLALDQHDRAAVIRSGLRSLDMEDTEDIGEDQDEVDASWRAELRRRIEDVQSGKVEMLDMEEAHGQIRAELAALRK